MSTTVELWKIEEAMRQAERRLEAADRLADEIAKMMNRFSINPEEEALEEAYFLYREASREAGDE